MTPGGPALRVAVCLPQVPFERGGAEILADALVDAINARGHTATLVTLPFRWHPNPDLLQSAMAWRMLDLTEANGRPIDAVIGTKYPSYLVRHPRKSVWLFHQLRQAYDLHGTPLAQFGDDAEGVAMRDAVRRMDELALGEARVVTAISQNVADRLRRFTGLHAGVLRPPPQDLALRWLGDDGYVLSVGRLDAAKRNDLLLRAAALTPGLDVVIAGDGPERGPLEALAAELGLAGRARFTGRVAPEALAELYGRCRAVFYAPFDEDFGLVPVEAHLAGKAVVTTTDAGGPLEVVEHTRSGLVTDPSPEAVAAALGRLKADPDLARRLGEVGASASAPATWDDIVAALLPPP